LKVPLSRELAGQLLLALLIPIGGEIYSQLRSAPFEGPTESLLVLLGFGVPSLYLAICLLHRGTTFRVRSKAGGLGAHVLTLPWREGRTMGQLMVSAMVMAIGLYCSHREPRIAAILLATGGSAGLAAAIAFDHPRVRFAHPYPANRWLADAPTLARTSATTPDAFSYSETGFTAPSLGISETAAWTAIDSIIAFKQDCFGVDRIWIELQLGPTQFSFSDETPGYMSFMITAEQHLPNFNSNWFSAVALPAFETNLTTVFERRSA